MGTDFFPKGLQTEALGDHRCVSVSTHAGFHVLQRGQIRVAGQVEGFDGARVGREQEALREVNRSRLEEVAGVSNQFGQFGDRRSVLHA